MSSTYSTNLGVELMITGEQSNTWGDITNTNLGTILEQAISGYVTQAVSTGTDTTITMPNGATGVARNMYIELTGSGGSNTNLIVPAKKKLYFIYNNTSSGQVTVKVSGQTGVSVANGKKVILVCDGTDVELATSYPTTPVPVADGGTGVTTSTGSGNVVLSTSPTLTTPNLGTPSALTLSNATGLPLTTGVTGTLPVANGGTGVTSSTGSGSVVLSTSPALTTPNLGTPSAATLTNATGLPLSTGVTGTLPVANGGTGQTSYTNGQLLIGNTTGNTLAKSTLTAGTGISITNGAGSITIASNVTSLTGITTSTVTALGANAGDSVTSATTTTAIGYNAGTAVTSGNDNTFVGYNAGATVSTGVGTTAVGVDAGSQYNQSYSTYLGYYAGRNVNGNENTGLGYQAARGAIGATGTANAAVGNEALRAFSTGTYNSALGAAAATAITSGQYNVAVGFQTLFSATTSNWNTAVGSIAGDSITSGGANTLIGFQAGSAITTGGLNCALGDSAYLSGNYSNSSCIGYGSAITGSNQVQLGNVDTTTYAYGAVVDRASDIRDKADVQNTNLGLNFIMALRPVMYRWDYREDYRPPKPAPEASKEEWDAYREACRLENLTHDGSKKRNRFHQGLIAQEVKSVIDSLGTDFGGYKDGTIDGGEDRVTLAYGEFIAPLIKAIQELKAEFDEYKRTHP